jgi:pimeloyl-ACP methyl ester carboxylesterase
LNLTQLHRAAQTVSVAIDDVDDVVNLSVLHFEGEGPERFLLLHGNPGSTHDIAPMISRLLPRGDVIAYDAPGFGRSPPPPSARVLAIESFAEIAIRVMDHFAWSKAVLVGHSHGGGVAQRVACRWPERVRALVLLGTLGAAPNLAYRLFPKPGVETMLAGVAKILPLLPRAILSPLVRLGMHAAYAPTPVSETALAHEVELLTANPLILRHMAGVTNGRPWALLKRDAAKIRAPTVFVHGDQDRLVPVWHARKLHDQMRSAGRNVRFELIAGAGHMVALDAPERCCNAVKRLLAV